MIEFRQPKENKIRNFWQWFIENAKKFTEQYKQNPQEVIKIVNARIKNLNRFLKVYINSQNSTLKLIISPDGIVHLIPIVKLIVENAPLLDGWEIIAFKPPFNLSEKIEINGKIYDLNDFYFTYQTNEHRLKLTVYFKGDNDEYFATLSDVFKIIEALIGEYALLMYIDGIKLELTNPSEKALPIKQLKELIEKLSASKSTYNSSN